MLRNTDVSQVKPEPYSVCFILVISLIVFFFFTRDEEFAMPYVRTFIFIVCVRVGH